MKDLIEQYISWLKQKISFKEVNDFYEITTPFLNHFNDHIQIFLKKNDSDKIFITDDGETLSNLEMEGLEFNTPMRKKELEAILNGYGIKLEKNHHLTTVATPSTFPMRKHNMIQAILAVDDLFVLAQPKVESFFLEDVINFLKKNEIRYTSNIILQGKSTFQHKFDILIPASIKSRERIVKVVNNPKKQNIMTHLFAFEDTKLARNNDGIVVLNDFDKLITPDVSQAIQEYDIFEFPWSKREDLKEKLAA